MIKRNSDNKKDWISGGMLTLFCTIFGYIISMRYEVGYANFFKIPESLIEFNLLKNYEVFFFLFSLFAYMFLIESFEEKLFIWNAIYSILLSLVIINIIINLFLFLKKLKGKYVYIKKIDLLIILVSSLIILIFLIIKQRKFKNKLSTKILFAFLIFYLTSNTCYSYGLLSASNKIEFITIKANPEFIVLVKYYDYFIYSEFERDSKRFSPNFKIMRLIDNPGNVYQFEKVGPIIPIMNFPNNKKR